MTTQVYVVDSNGAERLVRATSAEAALAHVGSGRVRVADAEDLQDLLPAVQIEDAS